jgi:hypothetical protein
MNHSYHAHLRTGLTHFKPFAFSILCSDCTVLERNYRSAAADWSKIPNDID